MKRISQRMSPEKEAIVQAIGEAASLHFPASKEVFKSDEAIDIADRLAKKLRISYRSLTPPKEHVMLTDEQIQKLTTDRLLALLNAVRRYRMLALRKYESDDGDEIFHNDLERQDAESIRKKWDDYVARIKGVLATRPHMN
jgi:hypothetical protein